jgi:hypothetical protein
MRVSKLLYKSLNVLVALAMMLVTVPAGGVVAEDTTGPELTITGATVTTNDVTVPMGGNLVDGYILITTNDPTLDHYLQFADGSVSDELLAAEYFGLKLVSAETTVSAAELEAYYNARVGLPENYKNYLIDAANGDEPFVFIKGHSDLSVTLVDAAQYVIGGILDSPMIVPDDFPLGTYTVAGEIKDIAEPGNTTPVKLILIVTNTLIDVTIEQAAGQADPTNASPINFTVEFSEPVTGFQTGDVTITGTAPGVKTGTVTGSGATYTVEVTGMTGSGTVIANIPAGVAQNALGNANAASTSTDNTVTYDVTAPTVTINQAAGQADPTNASPINFTVVFSEPVTGFQTGDVTITGTAPGVKIGTVTGSGATYTVEVTGMTGSGTVIANIPAGVAQDALGNANAASTSTDNTVTYDVTAPTVTINQAAGQADPTNASPINFTVVFSEPVTGFQTGDVTITGTAPGVKTGTVTGSGATYTVEVTGMTGSGTVIANIPAGVAQNALGNANAASTSTDNTVTYDVTAPTVTINQAAGQADPTNASPINFTVVFSEPVTGFQTGDVTITGTAPGVKIGTVTGSGATYTVEVTGMTGSGTVIANIPAGVAQNALGNANAASTSTDNTVTYDVTAPTVTINQAAGQADPTNASPINFTVVFSEPVTGFQTGDVTITGTAPGVKTGTVTGSGATYTVEVTGMTGSGTVIANIPAGVAQDAAGNTNAASTSTDNTVTYDVTAPTVTINQAAGQADPTNASPINFTVVFSEPVTGFQTGDVTITGTAPGVKTGTVTGSGATYTVEVTGMTGSGTVIANIPAGVAQNALGNANAASTSTDNTVTYDVTAPTVTINQAAGQADPTNASPINFTVVFSEPVTGFQTGDVTITGTAPGVKTGTVTGSGATYTVEVTGMTGSGTVISNIPAGVAQDAAGNTNAASTSTDNTVTYDVTAPTVTINQVAGQADPTNASPINFTVVFSEPVTGFQTGDVTITGTAPGVKTGTVTGSGATYTVEVTGMTGSGTVIANIPAGVAQDAAGNTNAASTSTDNTVTYDVTAPAVTINQAAGQADPTNASPINFTVVFSEPVTGFQTGDVTITGTAPGVKTGTVTGSGATYTVEVTGMTGSGTVIANIPAGVAQDAAGNTNAASTSTDNTVTYDVTAPTVTINQAAGQADPTNASPINFTVVFSEPVTGFQTGDVTITGTAPGVKTGTVTGSGATYTVEVTGMTGSGTVIANIPAGVAQDAAGNTNAASTSTDNEVTFIMRYTLTVSKGGTGALYANPSTGSTFTGWGGACSGTGTCSVTMNAAKTVTATFTLNKYTLTVSKVGEGTVTSSPAGIACGSTCSALFDFGTTVTLTAVEANGYSFTGWSGDDGAEVINNQILINEDKSVTANFETGIIITAVDDFYEMAQGSGTLYVSTAEGVLINDLKPADVSLYAVRILGTGPAQGDLVFDSLGGFSLVNVPSTFVGNLYFDYIACDFATDICSAEPATVTIAVKTVPTALADTYKMGLSTSMSVPAASGVLVNDSGAAGAVLTATVQTPPAVGALTLNSNGSFTYTRPSVWPGSVSFTYKACDGEICSTAATVTIEETDSCLVVDPTSLEKTLFQDKTGTLDLTLINECAVDVNFTLVESGAVTGTLLDEGFETVPNLTLPPTGWEVIELADRTWFLTAGTGFVDEGQYAAFVNYAEVGQDTDEWLISPVLDTSSLNNLVLSFRAYSRTNPAYFGATMKVWVLTAGEDKVVWDLFEDVSWDTYQYRTVQIDLSEFDAYDEIQIAWQYVSVDPSVRGETFGLDAVKVGARSTIPWLSQSPTSGTVAGGGERVITVTFTSGPSFGRYEGTLFVRNAPYPVINVPVTLIVRAEGNFEYFLPLITK